MYHDVFYFCLFLFFFNDTATTEIYTLSLHDALPISRGQLPNEFGAGDYHDLVDMPFFVGRFDVDSVQASGRWARLATYPAGRDRKSTRLNSSHANISYAVFCLKKTKYFDSLTFQLAE